MAESLNDQIAQSLDGDPELLPHLPELLADLAELGTSAEDVIDALESCELTSAQTAIDLGCGKGSVAVALAEKWRLRVTGVDGFQPFIDDARRLARKHSVDDLCRFHVGDVREAVGSGEVFDVALLLSVGSILGDLEQSVAALRRIVRKGGYIVIEDCFLAEAADANNLPPHYAEYADRTETRRRLQVHGDSIVTEQVFPHSEIEQINADNTEKIRRRAEQLAAEHPQLATALRAYVANQQDECEILEGPMRSALWVLQRGA